MEQNCNHYWQQRCKLLSYNILHHFCVWDILSAVPKKQRIREDFCPGYGDFSLQQRGFAEFSKVCKCLIASTLHKRKSLTFQSGIKIVGSGGWNRTNGLQVMSLTSYHCSTPHRFWYLIYTIFSFLQISIAKNLNNIMVFIKRYA